MTDQMDHILVACIAGLSSVLSAWCVAKIKQLHQLVNSRMTEMLALAKSNAQHEGELAGRDYTRAHIEARIDAQAAAQAVPVELNELGRAYDLIAKSQKAGDAEKAP